MKKRWLCSCAFVFAVAVAAVALVAGCGQKATPVGKNLLVNGSFEEVANGLPEGWHVERFKGMEAAVPAEWGIDEDRAYDGKRSFYFEAGLDARAFFRLVQTIKVENARQLRIRGAIKTLDVAMAKGQFPQANFALTCYDEAGSRFESMRFYDLKTQVRTGTSGDWISEDRVFRIPEGTASVEISCALGMEGKIWFDAVTVEVAPQLPWRTAESKNFTFHWLPGSEYPGGSMEYQQQLFDVYCTKLGVPEPDRPRIDSYFYPDSATLFATIGVRGTKKSYWDEREVHSVYPVDDHEIIHIITKPYGVLPFALSEGTAFYLMEDYNGRPVLQIAQELLKEDKLPTLVPIIDGGTMRRMDPNIVAPAAASFIGYLLEMWGPEKFLDLHREANATSAAPEFGRAFEKVYGVAPEKAEAEWLMLLRRLDFSAKAGQGNATSGAAATDTTVTEMMDSDTTDVK
jgi:hypothetical protein